MTSRVDRLLRGPHLRLPRLLDALSDWWSGRRPRVRMLLTGLAVVAVLLGLDARVRAVDDRWGGPPQTVFVTTRDLAAGEPARHVRRVRLPPAAVPPRAVTSAAGDQRLALAAPEGTVLTAGHLDPRGPAAGLPSHLRAIPVPTEAGWGVVAGGWVDVWVLATGDQPAEQVARARPVVAVHEDPSGLTALVGLTAGESDAVATGLALGRVLLAHAPGPG
jgi:hypothetical protein